MQFSEALQLRVVWDFLLAGGPVMWPLLIISVWLWVLIVFKLSWVFMVRGDRMELKQAVEGLGGGLNIGQGGSPRRKALALFMDNRGKKLKADLGYLEAAVRRQHPEIWRHLDAILTLAAVAPLLGLLGTVTGMVETFAVINQYGTGNAQALASGISEALITTQTGLLIAIPGLFAGYVLRRQLRKEQQKLYAMQQGLERWLKGREA
jgi:biopolymer transport protein ExbB